MLRNKGKGQGLVEFALILPILLMLLLGIIEGGRIIWAFVTVQNAAREAARYAVTGRPFACGGDPVDPAIGTPNSGNALDPAHFCDDPTNGDPWSPQVPTTTRVAAIKNVAVEQGQNLAVRQFAMIDLNDFRTHRSSEPAAGNAGYFGIGVIGQSAVYSQGLFNYGGEPGWNVTVQTYYNVEMIDPIYNVIMGGRSIHLSGEVQLQNEGVDATVKEYVGGINFNPDNCQLTNSCGGSQVPFIAVQDDFGDLREPAGGNFTVSVNDHMANTAYKLWFVHKDGAGVHASSVDFVTDSLGGKLVSFIISVAAPQGEIAYKIYTSLASDGGNTPVASCLSDLPTNAPCFSVETGNPVITVRNINENEERQQPDDPATWPISSSIPIYLFGHDLNTSYTIRFDGQTSPSAPGTLLYGATEVTQITTDAEFGSNQGAPRYYIATNHTSGTSLTVSSHDAGGERANAGLNFTRARINIAGETPISTHPQDDLVGIVLRDLAPQQQYQIFVEDGVSNFEIKRANDDGVASLSYRVPFGSHIPGDPPKLVEIYVYDYGRGPNLNKIARRTIRLETPITPYINVPGGGRWPAGSPITIQLRRHEYDPPSGTEYEVRIENESGSFSELINGTSIFTDQDPNPNTGPGAKDIEYTIPFNFVDHYVLRSFRMEPGGPVLEAEFDLDIDPNAYISVDGGNRWPPRSEIVIRLQGHAADTPYEVWLDRGGEQETFLGVVIVDEIGEGTIDYTIPQTMPTRAVGVEPAHDPPFYPIYSYRGNSLTADNGKLEVVSSDLQVTNIEVADLTFDIEIPVRVTISNQSPVTITDTYFDTDLYIDRGAAPNLASSLPPGDYKTWINNVPPNGTVTYDETIVLYGQQSHQIWGRVDTSDGVAETDEGNNLYLKSLDASCPVEIIDEFLGDGDGMPEWTRTNFGDSGPSCTPPAPLPATIPPGGLPVNPTGTIWEEHFNTAGHQFNFAKDTFTIPDIRFTSGSADNESQGSRVTDTGAWNNGALQVRLGQIESQGVTGNNMSGGWSRDFTVSTEGDCVTVQGYYRIHFPLNAYEGNQGEYGEVLLSVDGGLPQVIFTTQSLTDSGQNYDSGWVPFSVTISNLSAATHTLTLGGFNNIATWTDERMEIWFDDVYVREATPGAGTSSQSEAGGTLTLNNRGSSAITGDDNGTGAGYHFFNRPVGDGPFEVYARVDQPPANGSAGMAGLEIRGDGADGGSEKIMFVYRSDGRLKIYTRATGSSITVDENTNTIGSGSPVWLRIRRNGDSFDFHYAVSGSDTPPETWQRAMTNPMENFIMPPTVQVGLVNAPQSSTATLYNAAFKHFHICATSAPGGTSTSGRGYLGTRCGEVAENGNGLVVVDAVNTIINQPGGGRWDPVTANNVLGEPTMDGLESTAARPHATYQVNIESSGTFYVWVAGLAPSGSVDVGRGGVVIGSVSSFPTATAAWRQMSGTTDLTPGTYDFDLWANNGGIQVFKILLTSDAGFTPPPDGMAQSACTIIVEPHRAPLHRECVDPVRRGGFEGTVGEVTGEWTTSNLATVYSNVSYEGNRGAGFPTFGGRRPLIRQSFLLPSWILSDTTATLNLRKGVDLNSGGISAASDTLYFALRRESDGFDLITPILLADGVDRQPEIPDLDPLDPRPGYTLFNQNLFNGLNPLSFLEPGEPVRAYFYSPNPGVGTSFFLDKISLTFCTTQPEPVQEADKGKISGRTQRGSTPLVGATVWAYAFADEGSEPGPVAQTYSIQDGTYRFYNLEPGRYLVYAQISDPSGTFSDVRLVEVRPGGEVRNVILNLQTG